MSNRFLNVKRLQPPVPSQEERERARYIQSHKIRFRNFDDLRCWILSLPLGPSKKIRKLKYRIIDAIAGFYNEIMEKAQADELTRLLRPFPFLEMVSNYLSEESRSNHCCALGFADITDFKLINDTFGHAVGDEVLKGVADVLRTVREYRPKVLDDLEDRRDYEQPHPIPLVARMGGDEFSFFIHEVGNADDCRDLARRLVRDVQGMQVPYVSLPVLINIGIVRMPLGSKENRYNTELIVSRLFFQADRLMYGAKRYSKRSESIEPPKISDFYGVKTMTLDQLLSSSFVEPSLV